MATPNLELDTVINAQPVADFVSAFNSNMLKLDDMPIPYVSQSNSDATALKFADGTLFMYARINHGSTYKCNIDWEHNGGAGYASQPWDFTFPIATVGQEPVVIPFAEDSMRCETQLIHAGATTTAKTTFRYWSLAEEVNSGATKVANIIVIGRWK